jgi:F-type H+-transporting ATPase subunit b
MAVLEYLAELLAFAIVIWAVVRYVVPVVRKAMAERQRVIREQIETTRADKAAAEQAEAEFNRAHAGLAEETARLRDDARTQSQQIVTELQERARAESARIVNRGQEQLAAERDTAVRQLRSDAGRLAVDLAELVVAEFLRDERRRRASVGRALDAITADGGGAPRDRAAALTAASSAEESI